MGKYAPTQAPCRKLEEEKLLPYARKMQEQYCMWCEKKDYKECTLCKFLAELSLEGSNPDGGCPYQM